MIIENILRDKFHDELINAGIRPKFVGSIDNDSQLGAVIKFEEGTDMVLVQQIIDTHDPTPLPKQLTENEIIMLAIADLAEIVLGGMK